MISQTPPRTGVRGARRRGQGHGARDQRGKHGVLPQLPESALTRAVLPAADGSDKISDPTVLRSH